MTVKDPMSLAWFVHHRLLMLLSRINQNPVQKQKTVAREIILCQEP